MHAIAPAHPVASDTDGLRADGAALADGPALGPDALHLTAPAALM